MSAAEIVNKLLEGSPYDVDDPLEKPEAPAGFIARRDTERMECHYDPQAHGYRFSKFWIDPYTEKERVLRNGAFMAMKNIANASSWLSKEAERWRTGGWNVEEL